MKAALLIPLALSTSLGLLIAQAPPAQEAVGVQFEMPPEELLPTNRRPLIVSPEETNPFAKRAAAAPRFVIEQAETEEVRLRQLISELPVGGTIQGRSGVQVLLGPVILREGQEMPPLIPLQTERVLVTKLTPSEMTFAFVERNGEVGARTFSRNFSIEPTVRFLLPSQIPKPEGESPLSTLQGVVPPISDETP